MEPHVHDAAHIALTWYSIEAAILLSLFAAPLGAFLIFRRLSFFGDALGHASVAGVALVVLCGIYSPWVLSIGAFVTVVLTGQLLRFLERKLDLPSDVALTVSSAGFFAIGILLATLAGADLEHLLTGDLGHIELSMIWFLRVWTLVVLATLFGMWRPLWATVMDVRFASNLGFHAEKIDMIFLALISVTVVGLIQSVGAVLVATYLVFPATAALAWSRSLRVFVIYSIFFALVASAIGLYVSMRLEFLPGPCIAVTGFLGVLFNHLLARMFRWGVA